MTAADQTRRALADLDTVMGSADYPTRHHLAPGVTAAYINSVLAATGLTVPDELRAVWQWHNGTRPSTDPRNPGGPDQYRRLPGGHTLLSVERAVELWEWHRDNFPWDQLDTIERNWLPLAAADPGTVWVDCTGPPSSPAPVYLERDGDDRAEVEARRVASITRLVQLWTAVLERGIWRLRHPGDTVTLRDGRSYPLQVGRPVWLLDDGHPDLPPDWPG